MEGLDPIDQLLNNKQISHHFQPLYVLSDWRTYGMESFIRFQDMNPEQLFRMAKEKNQLYVLDTKSVFQSVKTYFKSGMEKTLFLNVFPSTLMNPAFFDFVKQLGSEFPLFKQRVVFEINEAEPIEDISELRKAIVRLREEGIRFALDDFGKGSSNISTLIELEPEYIKLDKYFAEGLHQSKQKQFFIESILDYCKDQMQLILEGIETAKDLAMAKSIGVPIAQGFLLNEPKDLRDLIKEQRDFPLNLKLSLYNK
ncbi:EAL domain-containing protein (putative c-di-GMP-specific phosphodiesterase class I) [Melghiribacillus thermohalophilus]|uniref:EAL domain-containing protein (Putative c-di-GMP-specific phosphodiesterase class I) n=1 Tax=Melghiribacillus thermohalophilus TaxID=1324956 RepID=A0A4R3N8F7_9BACI|nr:EAL domain-containing protein [Melghiribacillus thermohalophilus]TCT25044.1 EAL domain-containing protein (putative c-di-GMP-specific phosphodiesterase class I) [Melghiribacillus thermohalophilus]